ncbi:MAG: hypothetical protein E7812_03870 [Phenylobacterium sp.]|nr:MAG: hypothetical protein E7812_03870 [Phenylobacterium sp.]
MSVSSITTSTAASASAAQGSSQASAMRTAFQQLTTAIGSGDLKSAQAAYATISGLQQSNGQSGQSDGPFAQLMSSLGKDLQSGDLTTAQSDLASFQKAHGGHHHHHGGGAPPAASDSTTTTAAATPSSSTNVLDVSA